MAGDHSDDARSTAETDLRVGRQQVLIYEAVLVAAGDAHAVLDVLLDAADPDAAHAALRERYGFTEVQAFAVLDLQLSRVTSSQRQRIEQGLHEVRARVAELEEQLG
jgi:DNA gyrase/topoisomerase IV subunit A